MPSLSGIHKAYLHILLCWHERFYTSSMVHLLQKVGSRGWVQFIGVQVLDVMVFLLVVPLQVQEQHRTVRVKALIRSCVLNPLWDQSSSENRDILSV